MSVAVAQAESPDSANVALFQADRALSRCRLGSEALLEESPDLRSMMGAGQRPAVRPAILSRLRDPGLEPARRRQHGVGRVAARAVAHDGEPVGIGDAQIDPNTPVTEIIGLISDVLEQAGSPLPSSWSETSWR